MKDMNKRLSVKIVSILISILFLTSNVFAGEVGTVTYVEGRVDLLKAGSARGVPIRDGDTISVGDSIRTKSNSKAEVVFKDNTSLRLAQNSKIDVNDYRLDDANKRKTATLKLERGKARTIIAKMPDAADFIIATPNAEGKVKGSDIFAFYQAGNSGMLVAEGRLSVINAAHPEDVIVVPEGNSVLVSLEELPKGPRPYLELEKKLHDQDTRVPVVKREKSSAIKGAIMKLSGDVRITAKGQGASHIANMNEIIGEGDKIETGDNSFIEIRFDNGNSVDLKPNSVLIIKKLVIDLATGEYENLFESSEGKIRARIENLKGKSRFEVKTPTAVSGARGTIMYLEITPTSVRAFFEGGSGFVSNLISGLEATVAAGENAYSYDNGNVSEPTETPPGDRDSFTEGWNTGNGTEGYSSPDGSAGIYLSTGGNTGGGVGGPTIPGVTGTGDDKPFINIPITEQNFNPNPLPPLPVLVEIGDHIHDGYLTAFIAGTFINYSGSTGAMVSLLNQGNTHFIVNNNEESRTYGTYDVDLNSNTYYDNPENAKVWIGNVGGYGQFGYKPSNGIIKGDVDGTYDDFENWEATSSGTWNARNVENGSTYGGGQYFGFIGGVWDDGKIIGKMAAIYSQPQLVYSTPVPFSGTSVYGFNDVGQVSVTNIDGADTNVSEEPWGVWGFGLNGTYDKTQANMPFKLAIGGNSGEGYWVGLIAGIKKTASNIITGAFRGILLDLSTETSPDYDANLYIGDVMGTITDGEEIVPLDVAAVGEWQTMEWPEYTEIIPNDITFEEFLSDTYLRKDPLIGRGLGGFDGTGSINPFDLTGMTYNLQGLDSGYEDMSQVGWGIFYMAVADGAAYSNPDGKNLWSSVIGGDDSNDDGRSYWIIHSHGTWENGEIMGDGSGYALSDNNMVDIETETFGLYDEIEPGTGTWSAASVGSWVEKELLFGGEINGAFGFYNPEAVLGERLDLDTGVMTGLYGGVEDDDSFIMMGVFEDASDYRLWGTDIAGTASNGAAILGVIGGVKVNNILKGIVLALYISPISGSEFYATGYVTSEDFEGRFYPEIEMFEAEGTLTGHFMGQTSVSPEELLSEEAPLGDGYFYGNLNGNLTGTLEGESIVLSDQDWGLWRAGFGGTYSNIPSDGGWKSAVGITAVNQEEEPDGYLVGTLTGKGWSGGILEGVFKGISFSEVGDELGHISAMKADGIVVGDYIEVNETSGTWEAVGAGEWIEVTDLLTPDQLGFTLSELGDFVSVPITEVYSNTLTQTGLGSIESGFSVGLLNDFIDFTISQWADNKWVSEYNGRAGGIDITGQAGGLYGDGKFDGAGAGLDDDILNTVVVAGDYDDAGNISNATVDLTLYTNTQQAVTP